MLLIQNLKYYMITLMLDILVNAVPFILVFISALFLFLYSVLRHVPCIAVPRLMIHNPLYVPVNAATFSMI